MTAFVMVTNATLLAVITVPPLNAVADSAVQAMRQGWGLSDKIAGLDSRKISGDFTTLVQEGDRIASHKVTSGYGPRETDTLPEGASSEHKGVDLATPLSTKLYAPGNAGTSVKIRCWRDANGGGLVADIESPDAPTLLLQALHLEDCTTGMVAGGKPFATTGDSGIGDAHLDWRQRDRRTRDYQHPQQYYLLWALTGSAPAATLSDIDILRNAIIGQESAWESRIINADSGALGLGQVMPENLAPVDAQGKEIPNSGWDYEALGEDLTPEAFLRSPAKQIKIINYQLAKIHQQQLDAGHSQDEAIRRTAATWYSGNPDRADDLTPEYWDGDRDKAYPSVKEYSDQVLARVKTLQKQ